MSDGITDGTYQSKIPEINIKRIIDHKNVYADTAIYQVMATFGTETIQIFESDNKERAQSFIDSIISNGYLKTLNPTLKIVYVNHSIIEDGYYTYSHIYENGQTINFTIYNTPLTYNVADVIQGWQGYVVQFSTDVSHWWYDNHAYAYSSDGTDRLTTVYPNLNLLTNSRLQSGNITPFAPVNNAVLTINSNVKGLNVSCSGGAISYQQGVGQGVIPVSAGNQYTISVKVINTGTVAIDKFILQFGFYNSAGTGLGYPNKTFSIPADGKVYSLSYTATTTADTTGIRYYCLDTATLANVAHTFTIYDMKAEPGSTATPHMPSSSEVTTADWPSFIGTQHTPIGYLHDDPKWYDWQPFTGTLPLENTHTEFSFSTKLWDTIEEIKAIAPINKRNIRNDNWKYQPNETYPFIGGYES